MKSSTRFIFGLTLLLLLPALGYGQGVSGAFRITGKDIRVTEGFLSLELDISAFQLVTGKDASLEMFPVLRSGGNEKILPGISYRGSGYTAPENRAPFFAVYRDIVRDQQYNTSYSVGLAYESWMDSASLEFRQYLATEGRSVELSRKQMVRNITISHPRAGTLWSIDKELLPGMVEFLRPEDEGFKIRSTRFSAGIDYPVGKTGVLPGYGNNAAELSRIDTMMGSILTDSLVTVRLVTITGYSSPEGSYTANEKLSQGRSEGFRQYLAAVYPLGNIPVRTDWVAEDWNGLGRLVEASGNITEKQKVLDIIRNPDILPDTKDGQLQKIAWWSDNYRVILKEMYPRLRRIEVRTDYEVRPLNDNQAKELLYSRPEVLSLSEMMRVASSCKPGSGQYREVFEIAARHYPDDITANNNAAAALLLEGDARAATLYLEKAGMLSDRRTLVNRGVACYIAGDTVKAREYFTGACHSGMDKGCRNLELLNAGHSAAQAEVASGFGSPLFMSISHDGRPESESYRFAVKTNLLYDIALLPNLALEFPLGRRWSMEVDGQWSWWNTKTTHNNCWRIQTIGLEARKWLGGESLIPLTGHYLGIYGMAGTYDVKFRNKNGYLSDMSYSAGISYGYSFPVSRTFNLELGIAAGYFGGGYKVYDQYDPQNKMFPLKEKKDMHYLGLTKGKVSLVWIIGGGKH